MATPLDRIKILEPRHPNRSTGIINGRTSGILNWNDIPYPSFYRAYKELSTNFWIPDEVDMKADARQYGELSGREKNAYDSIIGLLAEHDPLEQIDRLHRAPADALVGHQFGVAVAEAARAG